MCQIWSDSFICQGGLTKDQGCWSNSLVWPRMLDQILFLLKAWVLWVLVITPPYHLSPTSLSFVTQLHMAILMLFISVIKTVYYCASYCCDQGWSYIALPSSFYSFNHMMIWYFPNHPHKYLSNNFAFSLVWFSLHRGINDLWHRN